MMVLLHFFCYTCPFFAISALPIQKFTLFFKISATKIEFKTSIVIGRGCTSP